MKLNYESSFKNIKDQLNSLSIKGYAKSRNFLNGDVSKLSAYISRGVISISDVYEKIINTDASFEDKESFTRQLAWREYWQRSAIKLGNKLKREAKIDFVIIRIIKKITNPELSRDFIKDVVILLFISFNIRPILEYEMFISLGLSFIISNSFPLLKSTTSLELLNFSSIL